MFEDDFANMLLQYKDSLSDKRRFTALIKDYFPDQPKNVNLLLTAYNIGIADELVQAARVSNTLAFRYVKQLMDDYGISRANADWIVSVWCVCLGAKVLRKPCDVKIQDRNSGPSIKEESQGSSGKNYGDLFTYSRSGSGNDLTVTGFNGEKKQTIIFQNRANGSNVIEIGSGAFKGSSIEEAILTEGIAYIGNEAFMDCPKLHQVVLPASIREIGDESFTGCINLKSVSLPAQLEKIGDWAFQGTGLRTIVIPKSVYWVGIGAFADCMELNNIHIPDNIDTIPAGMFGGCTSLKKIELNDCITKIGDRAFNNCSSLDFIVIPDSVTEIGENVFDGTDKQFIVQCSFGSYAEQYCRAKKLKYQLV